GKTVRSAALTPEQQQILEQRGNLSPDEIHKLAAKAKKKLKPAPGSAPGNDTDDAPAGKAACHSDYVDDDEAKQLQEDKGVETVPLGMSAMGIGGKDSVI
ncbi:MAG: hypothetical protein AAGK09_10860, partial [Planctomycetota bacterium]